MSTLYNQSALPLRTIELGGGTFDMSHLDRPSRPVHFPLIGISLLMACLAYWFQWGLYRSEFSTQSMSAFLAVYGVVSLALILSKVFRPRPHNWLSPDMLFWLVFTMFHIPYIFLYIVDLVDFSDRIFFSPEATNRALCCTILCMTGFIVGYELGPVGASRLQQALPSLRISGSAFQMTQAVFLGVATVSLIILVLGVGSLIVAYGYSGFRRLERHGVSTGTQRLVALAVLFFRIACVLYVGACVMRHQKVTKGVFLPAVLVGSILFFLLLGSRSEAAVLALPMIVAYHYFVRRIKLWLGIPALAATLIAFGVIGIGRSIESMSVAGIYRAYSEFRASTGVNPFVIALAESGGSISTVNVACTYIPDTEPFWYGRSLLDSFLNVIPNPIPGLRNNVAPSQWVTYRATGRIGGAQSGWGSSIGMEVYMNFGLLGGMIFMMGLGFWIRRTYNALLRQPTFLRVCLILVAYSALVMWCRNYSHHFMRPIAWTMASAWILKSMWGGSGSQISRPVTGNP